MLGNVFNMLAIIAGGMLTDRFGARRGLPISNIVGIPWVLVLFPLLNTGSPRYLLARNVGDVRDCGCQVPPVFFRKEQICPLHAQEGN